MTFVPQTMMPLEGSAVSTVCSEMLEALDAQSKVSQALKTIKESNASMLDKYNSYQVLAEFFNSKAGDGSIYSALCTEYADKVKQDLKSGLQSYLQNMVVQVPIPTNGTGGTEEVALQINGHDATAMDMINNWSDTSDQNFSVKWEMSDDETAKSEENGGFSNCSWLDGCSDIVNKKSGSIAEKNGSISFDHQTQGCQGGQSTEANGSAQSWADYTQAVEVKSGDGSSPLNTFSQDLPGWNC